MDIEIHNKEWDLQMAGLGGTALGKDYVGTVFKLSGKLWETVKKQQLPNKGKNIWVYESNEYVFAGLEMENIDNARKQGLEIKRLLLHKYAYFKHRGAYTLIKQSGELMKAELKKRGYEVVLPYIEIYGHWTNDESLLETELIMCLK